MVEEIEFESGTAEAGPCCRCSGCAQFRTCTVPLVVSLHTSQPTTTAQTHAHAHAAAAKQQISLETIETVACPVPHLRIIMGHSSHYFSFSALRQTGLWSAALCLELASKIAIKKPRFHSLSFMLRCFSPSVHAGQTRMLSVQHCLISSFAQICGHRT
jgi:hypothetical protein